MERRGTHGANGAPINRGTLFKRGGTLEARGTHETIGEPMKREVLIHWLRGGSHEEWRHQRNKGGTYEAERYLRIEEDTHERGGIHEAREYPRSKKGTQETRGNHEAIEGQPWSKKAPMKLGGHPWSNKRHSWSEGHPWSNKGAPRAVVGKIERILLKTRMSTGIKRSVWMTGT